jgi:hypothetical protein
MWVTEAAKVRVMKWPGGALKIGMGKKQALAAEIARAQKRMPMATNRGSLA